MSRSNFTISDFERTRTFDLHSKLYTSDVNMYRHWDMRSEGRPGTRVDIQSRIPNDRVTKYDIFTLTIDV